MRHFNQMKTGILTFALLLLSTSSYAQLNNNETARIASFCKLWGFLKYHHPVVAKGSIDWDKAFIARVNKAASLTSKKETSDYYITWINSLGPVTKCKGCTSIHDIPDSLKMNFNNAWIGDTSLFSKQLIQRLQFIEENRNQGTNYYVQQAEKVGNTEYENEKPYKDSIFPSAELRLLGLARYWNIVNYFYPYKYLIGEDWNHVLLDMIPKFKTPKDTLSYHLAMLELSAKLNDSHAYVSTNLTKQYFGVKWAPFIFRIIDQKAIVTDLYNDSLCKLNDIQRGDVFISVDHVSIDNIIKDRIKYIGASNEVTRLRYFNNAIFNGMTDTVIVSFERNGVISEKKLARYLFKDFHFNGSDLPTHDTVKILEANIGYVNLGWLQPGNVSQALDRVKNTKAIIFDVRNYPNGTMYEIADFLNKDKMPFSKFTKPDLSYPGVYQYKPLLYCGKKNDAAYPGKVVLLCNELTQSHAEFTLMALQTAPKVICIGSQTAGADGNVSEFTFPGGYKTFFTGLGVYYPDGRETQRIGIVPDVEIQPTIAGIKAGKDEVLDKAIQMINGN